jgi:predicted RNase H-like HicB family nuclease
MATFIAIFRKKGNEQFAVEFPDFPGCDASGRTAAQARENATIALRRTVANMEAANMKIPAPRGIAKITSNSAYQDGLAFLVSTNGAPTKDGLY